MTPAEFHATCLALWGEDWRPELRAFLKLHGMSYSRQSLYNWQHHKAPVPGGVAFLLEKERKKQKPQPSKEAI